MDLYVKINEQTQEEELIEIPVIQPEGKKKKKSLKSAKNRNAEPTVEETIELPMYLKNFDDHSEYEEYTETDYPRDNVSYCRNQDEVHYNPSYEKMYLTTRVLENNTSIHFIIPPCVTRDMVKSISYSIDNGRTWVTTENVDGERQLIETPAMTKYSEIKWKGDAVRMSQDVPLGEGGCSEKTITGEIIVIYEDETTKLWKNIEKVINYAGFAYTTETYENPQYKPKFEVYGNVMSLLYGDDFIGKDTFPDDDPHHEFYSLFFKNQGLVSAKNLVLPVKNLSPYCYAEMFRYCIGLQEHPKFVADVLAENSYDGLFRFATGIKRVVLPDAEIAPNACRRMLYEAQTIEYIKLGFDNFEQADMDVCLTEWNENTPDINVIFSKKPGTSYSIGANGIKQGWTVVEQ